jgi:catechol 2,3-dioxygenase-like lactoylglutathione lyase family enzyme
MIQTQGITHIHLAVRDLPRSVAFYRDVFGMEVQEGRSDDTMVFMRTPGSVDTLTLRLASPDEPVGQKGGGVDHFGFRLKDRKDLDAAVDAVTSAGGRLVERGEHAPGVGFAYVEDIDGYVIEL